MLSRRWEGTTMSSSRKNMGSSLVVRRLSPLLLRRRRRRSFVFFIFFFIVFFMMDDAVAWVGGVGRIQGLGPPMFVPLRTLTCSMENDCNEEARSERRPILPPSEPPLVGRTTTTTTTIPLSIPPQKEGPRGRIDILLNRNAKGVTPTMIKVVEDVVADYYSNRRNNNTTATATPTATPLLQVRIHSTSTLPHARAVVEEMSKHPPSLIIPVGGDGTLTQLLQLLWESGMDVSCTSRTVTHPNDDGDDDDGPRSSTTPRTPHRRRFPPIAYIAQGTGNALGSVVGCRPPRRRGQGWTRWRWWGWRRQQHSVLAETLYQLLCTVEQWHPHNNNNNNSTASSPTTSMDIVELPMIQVTTTIISQQEQEPQQPPPQEIKKSELCFFSGVGFDSLMLQDYKDLQEWTNDERRPFRRRLWKDALSSVGGYCVALVTRTLPRCINDQQHLIRVCVSTENPQDTVWIDHRRGDIVRSLKTDSDDSDNDDDDNDLPPHLLYQGEAGIVAVGSAPFYGGGLRLFPFARMTTKGMQLRIGRIHPLRGTIHLPQIFQGSYRDRRDDTFGCLDFMGPQFSISIVNPTRGYPVQHSGDFIGTSKQIDYRMMTTTTRTTMMMGEEDQLDPIQFVTLLPPRLVVEENG